MYGTDLQRLVIPFTVGQLSYSDSRNHNYVSTSSLINNQHTPSPCQSDRQSTTNGGSNSTTTNTTATITAAIAATNYQTSPVKKPEMATTPINVVTSALWGSGSHSHGNAQTWNCSTVTSLPLETPIGTKDSKQSEISDFGVNEHHIGNHAMLEWPLEAIESWPNAFTGNDVPVGMDEWLTIGDGWLGPLCFDHLNNNLHSQSIQDQYINLYNIDNGSSPVTRNQSDLTGGQSQSLPSTEYSPWDDRILELPSCASVLEEASDTNGQSPTKGTDVSIGVQCVAQQGHEGASTLSSSSARSSTNADFTGTDPVYALPASPGKGDPPLCPPLPELDADFELDSTFFGSVLDGLNHSQVDSDLCWPENIHWLPQCSDLATLESVASASGGFISADQISGVPNLDLCLNSPHRLQHTVAFRDKSKDELLLQWKAEGMSYKEIKERGGFTQSESTLRGRYRTLTKPKEARVRKPEWSDDDITILKEAVERYLSSTPGILSALSASPGQHGSRARQHALSRVSWKQVADIMASRGSYRFGNATVKKKYLEVMGIHSFKAKS